MSPRGAERSRPISKLRPTTLGRVVLSTGEDTVAFTLGFPWVFGSAAYWISQCRAEQRRRPVRSYAIGNGLLEEVAACILGGYGVPAEIAVAAFEAVRSARLLQSVAQPTAGDFLKVLSAPLPMRSHLDSSHARIVRYRFPHQRSRRLEAAVRLFAHGKPPLASAKALREWLCQIPGVGLKTASWIVRNVRGSNEVAIIDTHVLRAGRQAGFFRWSWTLPRDYYRFEHAFLAFARWAGVSSDLLDPLIWEQMRNGGSRVLH
jgi:hypothetical protein